MFIKLNLNIFNDSVTDEKTKGTKTFIFYTYLHPVPNMLSGFFISYSFK